MSLTRFRHADGGIYQIIRSDGVRLKMDDGRWEAGVIYGKICDLASGEPVDTTIYVTTPTRWAERFSEIGA